MRGAIELSDLRKVADDDQPRVQDIRLAERLGFDRPRAIRQLIERNLVLLQRAGSLPQSPRRVATATGSSPIANEYWLTEQQAIIVCMLSRTPLSDDVKLELSNIFQAWRRGTLAPISEVPTISGAIRDLLDLKPTVERIDGNVFHLKQALSQVQNRLEDVVPRRSFPQDILRQYRYTIHRSSSFLGKCPCGCGIQILDESGNILKNCHADHWYGPQRIGPSDGWYVDENCNQLLRDTEFRNKKISRYAVFHEERLKFFPNNKFKTRTVKRSATSYSPDQFKMDL